ncbi:hypothetical protein DT73_13455 [Mangrovibacter sp. MFB070]|nr:hypothetical protein DT73_13455 [Mangrovibacter sp. MFB070]
MVLVFTPLLLLFNSSAFTDEWWFLFVFISAITLNFLPVTLCVVVFEIGNAFIFRIYFLLFVFY